VEVEAVTPTSATTAEVTLYNYETDEYSITEIKDDYGTHDESQ